MSTQTLTLPELEGWTPDAATPAALVDRHVAVVTCPDCGRGQCITGRHRCRCSTYLVFRAKPTFWKLPLPAGRVWNMASVPPVLLQDDPSRRFLNWRRELPYGLSIVGDRETLFDRDYRPIWERRAGGPAVQSPPERWHVALATGVLDGVVYGGGWFYNGSTRVKFHPDGDDRWTAQERLLRILDDFKAGRPVAGHIVAAAHELSRSAISGQEEVAA